MKILLIVGLQEATAAQAALSGHKLNIVSNYVEAVNLITPAVMDAILMDEERLRELALAVPPLRAVEGGIALLESLLNAHHGVRKVGIHHPPQSPPPAFSPLAPSGVATLRSTLGREVKIALSAEWDDLVNKLC